MTIKALTFPLIGRRVAASLSSGVAIAVCLASCAGGTAPDPLDNAGSADYEIRNLETRIRCYRDNSFDWTLKTLVYSPSGRPGSVTKWAFRLMRAGQTIGVVDQSSCSQYGLRAIMVETRITVSSAVIHFEAERQPPMGYFCGVNADQVRFECTVDPDKGSPVDMAAEAPFTFSTSS
jgi:hypothetical protein